MMKPKIQGSVEIKASTMKPRGVKRPHIRRSRDLRFEFDIGMF